MTTPGPRPGVPRPRALALLAGLVVVACSPSPSPAPSASNVPGPSTPSPSAAPQTAAAIGIECAADPGTIEPALAGDPCPGAISAVELAVAPVSLPIERIVIQPGPFFCDVIWPGVASPPACYGVLVIPGQYMHAWVRFLGSEQVAAVMLGRDLPADLRVPAASPLPWNATLVTVEVPPAAWVMP